MRSPGELTASLAEDILKSIEGNEDLHQEVQPITPEVLTKAALKALGIVSTLLYESESQDRIFVDGKSRVRSLNFAKNKSDENAPDYYRFVL